MSEFNNFHSPNVYPSVNKAASKSEAPYSLASPYELAVVIPVI